MPNKRTLVRELFNRLIRSRFSAQTDPEYLLVLDYPIMPRPRYGEGKPAHPGLAAILAERTAAYRDTLAELAGFSERLTGIAETADGAGPGEPYWQNSYFSALDAITLYGLLALRNPARYMEIGSGNSTKFARRCVRDLGLRTEIISIDPSPRAEINALCDKVIRLPAEAVDITEFDALGPGDVLFVDNSHRIFMNSDVTVFFLDVVPRLKPGVTVHIHDIFLPFDYPQAWARRHYSEQYLLAAYLLAGYPRFQVLLPHVFVSQPDVLGGFINERWKHEVFQRAFAAYRRRTGGHIGTSFWLTIV